MSDHLLTLLAEPGQPDRLYEALAEEARARVGHQLFTLLYVDSDEVARVWSSRPAEYPVSGRKQMGPTPWGAHVLAGRQPWLGPDAEAIRWAFPDHALIAAMGLGAAINIPVVYDGQTIGTMNILDREGAYDAASVTRLAPLAPLLIPAFLTARHRAQATQTAKTE